MEHNIKTGSGLGVEGYLSPILQDTVNQGNSPSTKLCDKGIALELDR